MNTEKIREVQLQRGEEYHRYLKYPKRKPEDKHQSQHNNYNPYTKA